jgi:hypothetical protein
MKILLALSCLLLLAAKVSAADSAKVPVKWLYDHSDLIVVATFPFAEKDFEKKIEDPMSPPQMPGQPKLEYREYRPRLKIIKVLKGSHTTKGYLQVTMNFEVPVTIPYFKPAKDNQYIVFLMRRLRGKPEPVESENEYFHQTVDPDPGCLKANKATILEIKKLNDAAGR